MHFYDISIGTTGVRQIQAVGSYVYFLQGSSLGADQTILIQLGAGSEKIPLKPGQSYRLPDGQLESQWLISNYAAVATIDGTLLIGSGEFGDNRITGSVSVIDDSKTRAMVGTSFFINRVQAAVAAQYGWQQLFNPAGSGKNIALNKITLSSSAAQAIKMYQGATDANTGVGNPSNKVLGGAVGALKCSAATDAAATAAVLGAVTSMGDLLVSANVYTDFPMKGPLILPPGKGIALITATVNTSLSIIVDLEEF